MGDAMRARVSKKEFQKTLSQIVALTRSEDDALPALKGVVISAGADGIELRMTNLEVSAKARVEADVDERGEVAVFASGLSKLFQTLDDDVELSSDGEDIVIRSGRSRSKLRGFNVAEMPEMPGFEIRDLVLRWEGARLKSTISRVAFAAAEEDVWRPHLEGVCFDLNRGNSVLVATDGFRLSRQAVSDVLTDLVGRCVFPARSLMQAVNLFSSEDVVDVGLGDDGKRLFVKGGRYQFAFTRMAEGRYPDYNSVIPSEIKTVVVVNAGDFVGACKRVRSIAKDVGNGVVVRVGDNELTLLASDGRDRAETYVDAVVEGEKLSLAFNVDYLIEAVANLDSNTVSIGIDAGNRPVVFKREADSTYVHVLMPMDLGDAKA